uniref:Uncharacterized protein n=1 Tax=Eutreptiella gymnastica TaxID=73025 RepID=A0A7S1HSZ4_9EUGL|mmetsp:Transcript_102904/g.177551  ORF Transcript_102904/g.177551 Transcript_102904/m.177551 type:complete len:250 (+) Transcript_102904:1250-1999(+)
MNNALVLCEMLTQSLLINHQLPTHVNYTTAKQEPENTNKGTPHNLPLPSSIPLGGWPIEGGRTRRGRRLRGCCWLGWWWRRLHRVHRLHPRHRVGQHCCREQGFSCIPLALPLAELLGDPLEPLAILRHREVPVVGGGAPPALFRSCLGTLHRVLAATARRRGSCLGCGLGRCLPLLMLLLMLLLLLLLLLLSLLLMLLLLMLALQLLLAIALLVPARVRARPTPVSREGWPNLLARAGIRLQRRWWRW